MKPAGTVLAAVPGYVPTAPYTPEDPRHSYQRRYGNIRSKFYVGTKNEPSPTFGASVYRDAKLNVAELRIYQGHGDVMFDAGLCLCPASLVEIACRLLDAAADIEANPALEQEELPCFSK